MKVSNVSFQGAYLVKSSVLAEKILADESVKKGATSLVQRRTYGVAVDLKNILPIGHGHNSDILCATETDATSIRNALGMLKDKKGTKAGLKVITDIIKSATEVL